MPICICVGNERDIRKLQLVACCLKADGQCAIVTCQCCGFKLLPAILGGVKQMLHTTVGGYCALSIVAGEGLAIGCCC